MGGEKELGVDVIINVPTIESVSSAIKYLDSLSERIVSFVVQLADKKLSTSSSEAEDNSRLSRQREVLNSSFTLMRKSLTDLQINFETMVDNNKKLANHIEGTIQSANQEVGSLRHELKLTNQKVRELSVSNNQQTCQRCKEWSESNKLQEEKDSINRQLRKEMENLTQQLVNSEKRHQQNMQGYKQENEELRGERFELLNQLQEMQKTIDDKEEQLREFIREFHSQTKENEEQLREADEERMRLSKERAELSRQHDQLQDKVETLRNQLTKSEQRMREVDTELHMLRQMTNHHHHQGQKRRSTYIQPPPTDELLMTSRHLNFAASTADASSGATTPLLSPAAASSPVGVARFIGTGGAGADGGASVTSNNHNNHHLVTPTSNGGGGGDHDHHHNQLPTRISCGSSTSSNDDDTLMETPSGQHRHRNKHHGIVQSLSGSLSRAFKRHRYGSTRKSLDASHGEVMVPVVTRSSLFDRNDSEKKEMLTAIRNTPMHNWKAEDVAVWFELHMHMSQYVRGSIENVKSGKVLLGLSECEIERDLNMDKNLHRRKLMLALNEFRNANTTLTNMSAAGHLDHWWVSEQWLKDIALSQYAPKFREHLVDGRVLASLTKKDLEKYMGMNNRYHQESMIYGIKMLKMFNFDVKRLDERRQMSEGKDCDLLVWSCSRLLQWIKSIDLKEYATNLTDSGIHGALIVLDQNFSVDDVADCLGIPVNKTSVRRHLASEFDSLVRLARNALEDEFIDEIDRKSTQPFVRPTQQRKTRGLRSSFTRSISRSLRDSNGK